MSKARLKKQLLNMTAEQLSELLLELYDIRKEARDYLEFWVDPDPAKTVAKAEKEVRMIFYTSTAVPRRKPSLSELNRIVKHFMTLGLDRDSTAEFLLYVAETECGWLELRWRRLSYRSSMKKNLEAADLYIENAFPEASNSEHLLKENPCTIRLERLRERVSSLFYY